MENTVAVDSDFVAGNYFDKYRSGNPIHQKLMRGFLNNAFALVQCVRPNEVLEVGCGPGDLASNLFRQSDIESKTLAYIGTDVSPQEIEKAKKNYPYFEFQEASIYELPFDDNRFDLVLACEVLEHLETPQIAVSEIARVTNRYAIVSVPWEPTWRALNMLRGKYLTRFGNTPGHLQNFSRSAIRRLLRTRFKIIAERRPLPWSMFLVEIA
ncbi:MAG: class I SAM-dependent methyltransferase [Planctomycetales bacterium]|nr:class I SAM-dependent methyltransferase [Planctomycetales bacterium]